MMKSAEQKRRLRYWYKRETWRRRSAEKRGVPYKKLMALKPGYERWVDKKYRMHVRKRVYKKSKMEHLGIALTYKRMYRVAREEVADKIKEEVLNGIGIK